MSIPYMCKVVYPKYNRLLVQRILNTFWARPQHCSNSARQQQEQNKQYAFNRLPSFGTVLVKSRGAINYTIRALDPVKHPDQDIAAVDAPPCVQCMDEGDDIISLYGHYSEDDTKVDVDAQVPLKFDVAGNFIEGSCVDISELESKRISLNMDKGTCSLHKVKCDMVDIRGHGTPVSCRPVLHANASIVTHGANIRAEKLLGDRCELECVGTGNVYVGDSYVNRFSATTHRGHIDIGGCHRDAHLSVIDKGRVEIGSLDGNLNLKAAEAHVTVHIQRHQTVIMDILTGNVRLTLPRDVDTYVRLAATDLSCDNDAFDQSRLRKVIKERKYDWEGTLLGRDAQADDSGSSGVGQSGSGVSEQRSRRLIQIKVHQGSIHLSSADWLSRLKLDKSSDNEQ